MSDERFERDLGEVVRNLSGEDASPDLRARLAAVAERPAARRATWFSAGWRIGLTVAAALVLVAVISLFAPRLLGPEPASSPTSSASAAPVPETWTGLHWSAPVAPPDGTQIRDILAWGGEWVGVGVYQQSDTQSGVAAFLTSSDGTHWTVAYHYNALEIPTHLVPLGKGLLAVSDQGVMLGGCCSTPSLWQSDDGSTWYGIQPRGDWNAWIPDVHLLGVAGGPNGVVVIASGPDSAPIILHSTDGRTWTRVSLPASFDHAILLDVTAFGGGFVVVGRDGQPDVPSNTGPTTRGVGKPAAWISSDGVTWTAAQVEGSPVAGGQLSVVAAGAAGLYALGEDGLPPGADLLRSAWVSTDGRTWQRARSDHGVTSITQLAGDGQRILRLTPDEQHALRWLAWVSAEGLTWTNLPFAGATDTLPVGGMPGGGDPLGQVWVGPSGVIVIGQWTGGLRFGAATGASPATPAPTPVPLSGILATPAGSATYDRLVADVQAASSASTYLKVQDPLWTVPNVMDLVQQCASWPAGAPTTGSGAQRAKGACSALVFHFYTDYRAAFSSPTADPGLLSLLKVAQDTYAFAIGPLGPYGSKAELDDYLTTSCTDC
jgi:hypothetical protein